MIKHIMINSAVALVSLSLGAVGGHYYSRAQAQKNARFEIEEIRESYRRLHKKDEYETVEKAHDALIKDEVTEEVDHEQEVKARMDQLIDGQGYRPNTETENEVNIFDQEEEVPEGDPIVTKRTPNHPYTISEEEFMRDMEDYGKFSLTYFSEDDVLIDDRQVVVPDIDGIVGYDNLASKEGVINVRNEKMECDYEVSIDDRAYAEVILRIPKSAMPTGRILEDD